MRHSCDQLRIGETLANGGTEKAGEAFHRVVADIAVPKAKGELANIAV